MTDKELIRRALLGSREAQQECMGKKDCEPEFDSCERIEE